VNRRDRERLDDIAGAIEVIRAHVATGETVDERLRRDAILYNLVIVGEAVKGLSAETRARRPDIPWRQIAGLRDRLAHEYFRIDMNEIAKIVERDLGSLSDAVAALRHAE
jgi:uncharacterized protein with HEPN domain